MSLAKRHALVAGPASDSPGCVWTPRVENQIPDAMKACGPRRDQVINHLVPAPRPTKQFVAADRVAALLVYPCSANAARITGTNLSIDSGWTLV